VQYSRGVKSSYKLNYTQQQQSEKKGRSGTIDMTLSLLPSFATTTTFLLLASTRFTCSSWTSRVATTTRLNKLIFDSNHAVQITRISTSRVGRGGLGGGLTPVVLQPRVNARGRDEFDDEDELREMVRGRKRRRTIVKEEAELQPDAPYFDESFDVDEFLKSEGKEVKKRTPMALDMADPGRAVDRWPELMRDKAALRDIAIVFGLIWLIDRIYDLPVPIEMIGPGVIDYDTDLFGIDSLWRSL
jgi:hypothetical protein